jgi:hypothetical protein
LFCWAEYSHGEPSDKIHRGAFVRACPAARPKETEMQGFHQARANESRLRVVFGDDQVSFGFPASATLGDVAVWVAGVARFHHGAVIAIAVTMPARANSSIAPKGVTHGTH